MPGAKIAANALKPVQNYLRDRLGINQPKATAAAPVASTGKQPTGKVTPATSTNTTPKNTIVKPAASPATATAPAPAAASAAAPTKQTFGQAFAAARKSAGGAGGSFTYNNKQFQTNLKGEKYSKSPTPVNTAPAPAKLGGSDKTSTGQVSTTTNNSVMDAGRVDNLGKLNKTPIQRQELVPSTDRGAATRQMFDMNRKSPGSTADLANQVDKANAPKPTTAMPKPPTTDQVKSQFGSSQDLAKDIGSVKPMTKPTIRESVQVGTNKYRIV